MRTNSKLVFTLATLVASGAVSSYAPSAHADEVSPTGKGIVGGSLLGAEVVTITESIAGVRAPWAYAVGGILGAAGGGVGGYFVEQASTDAHASVYMLAGGLGLVIPALVLTLNATRYRPTDEVSEDRAPTGPAADPGTPGGSAVVGGQIGGSSSGAVNPSAPPSVTPAAPTTPPAPPSVAPAPAPSPGGGGPPLSLFDVHGGAMRIGVPVPEVRPVYSARQMKELGVPQQTEARMPVLNVLF